MSTIRAVFFNLTGALLDESGEYHAMDAAMASAAERFGLAEAPEDLTGELTLRVMDAYAAGAAETHRGATVRAFRGLLRGRGVAAPREAGQWFWSELARAHGVHGRVYADAAGALNALRARGLHVGVVTGSDAEFVEAATGGVDLGAPLDSLTTADEVGALDVSPRLFRVAVEKVPCRPREALAVGCSFERDVASARGAGLHTVLLDRHGARTVEGVLRIESLRGLPALVDRLGGAVAYGARP